MHRPVAMKKSVIKRRKRVVPTANEQDLSTSQLTTFPVSPSPTPQHLDNSETRNNQRGSSTIDINGPLDLRPPPAHLENPEIRNQQISSSLDPNSPSHLALRHHDRQMEHQLEYDPPPIGVDFTGYQLDQQRDQPRRPSSHPHQQFPPLPSMHDPSMLPADPIPHARLSPMPGVSSRKRSRSNAEQDDPSPSTPESASTKRLSSISSILNHPQSVADDLPIDPNLSSIGQPQPTHRHSHPEAQPQRFQLPPPDGRPRQSISSDPGGWELRDKKARLRREAEQIREMLRAKEKELEELDGEG